MTAMSLSQVSWRSNLRAVLAVARRDALFFIRYPMNAVFNVLHPLIWLTPVYFLSRAFTSPDGQTGIAGYIGAADYMSFAILGMVLSHYISVVFWGMGYALKTEMDLGVLESNWMTPIPRAAFLVGHTLASLAITTVSSALMLGLAWALFGFQITGNVLVALGVAVPMLIALYGFGFAFAAIVLLMRDANTMIDVSNFLVTTLSGSQFPVQVLPWGLLVVSLLLPLTYGFDAMRGVLIGSRTLFPLPVELAVLVAFMVGMVVIGRLVFNHVDRLCRQRGSLNLH